MTLITHIWTDKISIIAGDGRVTNQSAKNPIVTDDLRKIFPSSHNFIAFHASTRITSKEDVPTMLKETQSDSTFSNTTDMTDFLCAKMKHQEPGLSTGLFYGGYFNKIEALYLKGQNTANDSQNSCPGLRINSKSNQHHKTLLMKLDDAFESVTSKSYKDYEEYDNHSEDQYLEIMKVFYEEVHNDPKANLDNGIGNKLDVGVIKKDGFRWLQKETKTLTITNPDL